MTMTQWQAVVIWKSRQKTMLKFELKWVEVKASWDLAI